MVNLHLTSIALLALLATFSRAYDPSTLQDFCVAVPDAKAAVFVNGKVCKNPKQVTADDFFIAAGLNTPGNTKNSSMGTAFNVVDANRFPGLNTMGLTIVRADFAPNGLSQLHTHPRASEFLFVLEGTFYVGFVTSNQPNNAKNTLFAKILNPGDAFIIPQGLIHFQYNIGHTNAVAFVSFNSQNPGVVSIPNAVFGSAPLISDDVLGKAFRLEKDVIDFLQSQNWS